MLQRALQSLAAAARPTVAWEVLVIDNGSSNDTLSIVESFCGKLPIRYVHEEVAGLSNARNRAVREARGDWIVWTDDDVTVSTRWLVAYVEAIEQHSDAKVLGGPIAIEFEGSPPTWLMSGLSFVVDAYAGRMDFRGSFAARGPKPYGANFALQRPAALSLPFDPTLGRHPLWPTRGGEETVVIAQVLTNGAKGWWVPDALITHHIDASRQSTRYLRSYFIDAGWRDAVGQPDAGSKQWAAFAGSFARACVNEVRYLALRSDGAQRAQRLRDAAWHWGHAKAFAERLRARGLGGGRRRGGNQSS